MISIIIPALNEEHCLPKLLDCIKNQSFKDYEVIVSDAGSKDKTKDTARKFSCKIVKGGLPGIGRNNGANVAKGAILLFLDADAQISNDFLKNAINEMDRRKLDVAGCYIYPLSHNITDKIFLKIFNLWIFSTQFFYPNASGSCIFCKKWLHQKVKGFDETIKLSEDMDYVRRCSKYGKFRILKSVRNYIAMRRFEKEGRLKVGFKLLLSALYRLFFGEIRSDVFKYNLKYRK